MPANILIAIPTYGDSIRTMCFLSLMQLGVALHSRNIGYETKTIDMAGIDMVRNIFGSFILQEKKFTHLLFVDSDMQFEARLVERLITANKPLIGYIYPKRSIDLAKFYEASKNNSFDKALSLASEFVLGVPFPGFVVSFRDGLGTVQSIGMGLTLIQRSVFEQMAATGKIPTRATRMATLLGLHGTLFEFFRPMKIRERTLSEDLSFCERWRELCSGEVWAFADEEVGHIGSFIYRAKFIERHKK